MTEEKKKENKTSGSSESVGKEKKATGGYEISGRDKKTSPRRRTIKALIDTVRLLINVAAVAVLVAVLLIPVLRIYGNSMTPSLVEGDLVVSIKGADFERGDIIAFYYNNKVLVKRAIAFEGDWVDISEDGELYINGELQAEPYVEEQALGTSDITYPYQVPEERYFVMGDDRAVSVDSRSSTIGCVAQEQVVGKIVFRIWPLNKIGPVE